jgi:hypothetical protein
MPSHHHLSQYGIILFAYQCGDSTHPTPLLLFSSVLLRYLFNVGLYWQITICFAYMVLTE